MQRDFLPPLYPVTNKELILLASQHMTVYDLEVNRQEVSAVVSIINIRSFSKPRGISWKQLHILFKATRLNPSWRNSVALSLYLDS